MKGNDTHGITKHLLGTLLGVMVVLTLMGCGARGAEQGGGEDRTYTIKFSHVVTPKTPKGLAAEKFKEVVEEKSGGKIKVEVYPNSQLYGDEEELQALQSGSVQMLAPAAAKFGTITPRLQVLDLPFLFETPEDVQRIISRDSKVGQAIYNNEDLAAKNIKVLGLWDLGFKQIHSNKAIRRPEDLKGQKLRIQSGSDVLRTQMETWGASPTPMAFGEVFNALQQGVIDGGENAYSSIESQKFNTVQKYITVSNHGYIGYVLVINDDFFNQLPEDLQTAVTEAADEATALNREITERLNSEAREKIEKSGTSEFIELTSDQRQAFKDAVVPAVWDEYADVIGQDLIDELKSKQQ